MSDSSRRGCTPDGQRHYEVVSPPEFYSWFDPPEDYVCWGCYLAPNARAAKVMAVRDPKFGDWVKEQRANHSPPFRGLVARPFVCDHGRCLGCDGWDCQECEATENDPHNHP